MTRAPTGRRSSRNPSPCMNNVGGVERSTSSTNPGRGLIGWPPSAAAPLSGALCPLVRSPSARSRRYQPIPFALVAEVEGDLHRAPATGAGGVLDRLAVAVELVGGRHQPPEPGLADELDGELESGEVLELSPIG